MGLEVSVGLELSVGLAIGPEVPQAGKLGSWYKEVMKRPPHISSFFPAQG